MKKSQQNGFTLIEMLLVLAIMSAILLAIIGYTQQRTESMRRDRTVLQIQQIENAALSYYISISRWPATLAELQVAGFLPTGTLVNPYGGSYFMNHNNNTGTYALCTTVSGSTSQTSTVTAQIISGRIVQGIIVNSSTPSDALCVPNSAFLTPATTCAGTACTVASIINIPGQNLNNARSVNFTGVYHHGACVPAPSCPGASTGVNQMVPSIVAVPVSVSGVSDPGNTITYPISSFTAYAEPLSTTTAPATPVANPPACESANPGASAPNCSASTSPSPNGLYWRVCLQVISDKQDVSTSNPTWGQTASILAITRCVPNNEPYGSDFSVFQRY